MAIKSMKHLVDTVQGIIKGNLQAVGGSEPMLRFELVRDEVVVLPVSGLEEADCSILEQHKIPRNMSEDLAK